MSYAQEAFADRAYQHSGQLVPRTGSGASLGEAQALQQGLELTVTGRVQTVEGQWLAVAVDTLCVHGNGPHATTLIRALCAALSECGVVLSAPLAQH